MIRQGEVYWIDAEALRPAHPGRRRPHVVVQADVLNASRVPTVVVCALSTKAARFAEPGNVALEPGEAGLPQRSVVVVSELSVVDKDRLGERVGQLGAQRVEAVLAGMRFQQRAYFREREA